MCLYSRSTQANPREWLDSPDSAIVNAEVSVAAHADCAPSARSNAQNYMLVEFVLKGKVVERWELREVLREVLLGVSLELDKCED